MLDFLFNLQGPLPQSIKVGLSSPNIDTRKQTWIELFRFYDPVNEVRDCYHEIVARVQQENDPEDIPEYMEFAVGSDLEPITLSAEESDPNAAAQREAMRLAAEEAERLEEIEKAKIAARIRREMTAKLEREEKEAKAKAREEKKRKELEEKNRVIKEYDDTNDKRRWRVLDKIEREGFDVLNSEDVYNLSTFAWDTIELMKSLKILHGKGPEAVRRYMDLERQVTTQRLEKKRLEDDRAGMIEEDKLSREYHVDLKLHNYKLLKQKIAQETYERTLREKEAAKKWRESDEYKAQKKKKIEKKIKEREETLKNISKNAAELMDKPYILLPNGLKADSLQLAILERFHEKMEFPRPENVGSHKWNKMQTCYRFVCERLGLRHPKLHFTKRFAKLAEAVLQDTLGYMKVLSQNKHYYSNEPCKIFKYTRKEAGVIEKPEHDVKQFKPKYPLQWYKTLKDKGPLEASLHFLQFSTKKTQNVIAELRKSIVFWEKHHVNWYEGNFSYVETKIHKEFVRAKNEKSVQILNTSLLPVGQEMYHKHNVSPYEKPFLSRIVSRLHKFGLLEKKRPKKIRYWRDLREKRTDTQRQNLKVGRSNREQASIWLARIRDSFSQIDEKPIEKSNIFAEYNEKLRFWSFKKYSWSYDPDKDGRKRIKSNKANYQRLLFM
jgi:hypothetical protein